MKTKIPNKSILVLGLSLIFAIITVSFAYASSSGCSLNVSLVNQDPYPAIPNDNVELVFQISGVKNTNCEGARITMIPSYPLSLYGDSSTKTLEGSTWTSEYENNYDTWTVSYNLKVEEDALDGTPKIEVHYSPGSWKTDSYLTKEFDIMIEDPRTDFDAVIQDITDSDVSIALANVGKYAANSVVVRIPEQEGFKVTGTNGQMVGNLDSGDYTIVSFSLTPTKQQLGDLEFDIYYTDALGERRIVNMELPLKMNSALASINDESMPEVFQRRQSSQAQNSWWSNWYILIILAIILGIAFLYREKIIVLFNKRKSRNQNSGMLPEWIKNTKAKERAR